MKKWIYLMMVLLNMTAALGQTRGAYVVKEGLGVIAPTQEKRYALVIGNNAYQYVGKLHNAVNDATDIAKVLRGLGFEVDTLNDAGLVAMNRAIKRLGRKAQGQHAVSLFYYSGHGLQIHNDNWLVPTDAEAQTAADVQSACVSLKLLMDQLEQANTGTNIVILDACRNNPFEYSRNTGGGLAQPNRTPTGTYIAFSTAPLTTASDGADGNSPYSAALKTALQLPNLKIEDMFKQVRREVKRMGQTPWENSSLEGDFYFNPQVQIIPEPVVPPKTTVKPEPVVPKLTVVPEPVIPKPTITPDPVVPNPNLPAAPSVLEYTETIVGTPFVMKRIKGGTFQMGSNEDGAAANPIHSVEVSSFYMGKYEVTVGEYLKFCNATNAHYPEWLEANSKFHFQTGTDDLYKIRGYRRLNEKLPIVGISWDNAVAYCVWLSEQTGKTYRLPTEAEWEYAARGGQLYVYAGSNSASQVSWSISNSIMKPQQPVGSKLPNSYGLYDMSGNVWEWCSDWYGSYSNDAATIANPIGSLNLA